MKNFTYSLGLILITCLLCSCVSLEQVTLPANQKKQYEFASYNMTPLAGEEWRFLYSNSVLQAVGFLSATYQSHVTFWVTPVLENYSEEDADKDCIDYFQNKTLKKYKLDPDTILSEHAINRSTQTIDEKNYRVLSIDYGYKKGSYQIKIYRYLDEESQILHNVSIWIDKAKCRDMICENRMDMDLKRMMANTTYKMPREEDMIDFKVDFACDDFNENLNDRYIKEKVAILGKKYQIAKAQIERMIAVKKIPYRGYFLMGGLNLFNEKFEKYGEGFNKEEAVRLFQKSISLRKYFKPVYIELAKLYVETKEIDKAIENYQTAIQISPNDDNLYYELGKIYENQGDQKQAKIYYEKAIRYWRGAYLTMEELKKKIKKW